MDSLSTSLHFLETRIEALIFCSLEPLPLSEIKACLEELLDSEIPKEDVMECIAQLKEKYKASQYAFQVTEIAGGYQFLTKPSYHEVVNLLLKQKSNKKLTKAALETLAIIAYRQPITKTEIEGLRGVSSDYAVQKLLEKELIVIKGKEDSPGKPILYGTHRKFMEHFGLKDLGDLPQLQDFTAQEEEEDTNDLDIAPEKFSDNKEI